MTPANALSAKPLNPQIPPSEAEAFLGYLGIKILQSVTNNLKQVDSSLELSYRTPPNETDQKPMIEILVKTTHLQGIQQLLRQHLYDFKPSESQGSFLIQKSRCTLLITPVQSQP